MFGLLFTSLLILSIAAQNEDQPGHLPSYVGDQYTNKERISDTQTLNGNSRARRQVDSTGWDNSVVPGYLPDYRGDKYTNPQRIADTQALNKPFFDSIGGEPVYPGGVPPKTDNNGINNGNNNGDNVNTQFNPNSNNQPQLNYNQPQPNNVQSNKMQSNNGQSSYNQPQSNFNSPSSNMQLTTQRQQVFRDESSSNFLPNTFETPRPLSTTTRNNNVNNVQQTTTPINRNTNAGTTMTTNNNLNTRTNNLQTSTMTNGNNGQMSTTRNNQIGSTPSYPPTTRQTFNDNQNSQDVNPGYLPDYRGDKYTDPQRILDTQALNKAFFDSIQGEPVYPGGVPPKQPINSIQKRSFIPAPRFF